jgi:hypothetical protein
VYPHAIANIMLAESKVYMLYAETRNKQLNQQTNRLKGNSTTFIAQCNKIVKRAGSIHKDMIGIQMTIVSQSGRRITVLSQSV